MLPRFCFLSKHVVNQSVWQWINLWIDTMTIDTTETMCYVFLQYPSTMNIIQSGIMFFFVCLFFSYYIFDYTN